MTQVHPDMGGLVSGANADGNLVFHGQFKDLAPCGIEKCAPVKATLTLNMSSGAIDMENMEKPRCCMPKGGCCGTGTSENTGWSTDISSVSIVGKDKGCCHPCGTCIAPCVLCATCGQGRVHCGGAAGLSIVGPATGWNFFTTSAFHIPLSLEDARSARDAIKLMKRPAAVADMER